MGTVFFLVVFKSLAMRTVIWKYVALDNFKTPCNGNGILFSSVQISCNADGHLEVCSFRQFQNLLQWERCYFLVVFKSLAMPTVIWKYAALDNFKTSCNGNG